MTDYEPLTEDELQADSLACYHEAVQEIGARVKAGVMDLPAMFRPAEPEPFWTPDRFEKLCGMWCNTDLSAQEIGRVLGCSKNSVMGKVHRARLRDKLPHRKAPELIERPRPPLLDVGTHDCRFPIGNPGEEGFHFCRQRVETEGRSYCDEHHRLSVNSKVKAEDLV